jgi:hypothetical protein|tara:strand:+ start:140 stop:340 length:201 start_codon:yes stop_codon:yes gene_type:complete
MEMTDKGLASMRDLQNTIGKEARREIKRRQLVGYSDGTNIQAVDAKAVVETESRVGTVTIVSGGAR